MTMDREPDRLVEAWLDEGPRTFSPRLLDRTLADIHATPQQRRHPAPWRSFTMSLTLKTGLAGALVLALVLGAGAFLPWLPSLVTGPATSPSPAASPSPSLSPVPSYLPGDVPLTGTDWRLVGRIDADRGPTGPAYISAIPTPPASLRFGDDGALTGTTGCHPFDGTYTQQPRKAGQTSRASIVIGPIDDFACGEPIDTQDRALLAELPGIGALQLTTEPYATLASGLTDADLDPTLLAHFQAWPDLTRLILRDQSGEGTLIYAPISEPTIDWADRGLALVDGAPVLPGVTWGLVGYLDGESYRATSFAAVAPLVFADDGTLTGSAGCGSFGGTWAPATDEHDLPTIGDLELDIFRACAAEHQTDSVLTLLQAVEPSVRSGLTIDPAPELKPAEIEPALMGALAEAGTAWFLVRDQDDRVTLIYAALKDQPLASPTPIPSTTPIAFAAG